MTSSTGTGKHHALSRAATLLSLLLVSALTLTLGIIGTVTADAAEGAALTRMEVEKKVEPVGIDVDRPRFSWVITSEARGVAQKSYRLQLATSQAALEAGTDLVWDSGTVASDESSNLEYTGPALAPATHYVWKVDVSTNAGAASATSHFRTGLHTEEDWAGSEWIGNARAGADEPELDLTDSSWIWTPDASPGGAPGEPRAFRATYDTPSGKEAASADILITADDSFRLSVNGAFVAETQGAENEWQQSHLFTVGLEAERNVLAVRTTNGPGSPAGLIAAVRVHYTDGSSQTFHTDTSWKASIAIPEGFTDPAFDDSAWGDAAVVAEYGSSPWGTGVRPPTDEPAPAPLLRREFTVDDDVSAATLYLAAGGYADVMLNGARVNADMLSPGFADYDDTVQYVANDLTDQLQDGTNAIGMELGRGFYGMTGANVWRWESAPWHDEPVVRAVLRIEYADGRVENVVTDDSWTIHDGPTVFDDLYAGETYDASLVQPGFDTAGFADSSWAAASEVDGPVGELVNQRQQPIRVIEELPAVGITEPAEDTYVVKFPRVLAGNVEVTAEGAAGETIRFQYGEKLLDSGLVNFSNNGGFASGFQTDRLILAGTGEPETWEARFSYKGFQYIQVTGWPGEEPPPLEAFTAKLIHTDAAETGSFESSEEIMNRVHRAVVDTLKNNIHHIPTDTPMFEKNGWTGDAVVGAEMFLMNLDTHELFAKWMRDVHETRDENGAPLVIAPSSGDWGQWGVAPTWHSAYVMLPRWLYQYGNDTRVMEELYEGMAAYVDVEFDRSPNGIANSRLGDWVAPEASPAGGNPPEDTRVSATAYLYLMLTSMQETATFLGETADAVRFGEHAAVVKESFNAEFLDTEQGYYRGAGDRGYRQTHNVLALAFGLAPDDETAERVVASLVADITAKGGKLNTGVLGTKYLLPVLTDFGHEDVAFQLAVETGYPSWGYMVENGGTSMWEHWSLEARSLGHYFLGTVDDWFYHDVAGINASPTEGYRDITIRPAVTGEMDWARATTQTPFGPVTSDWRQADDGTLQLDVHVPVGSTATVHVPAQSTWAVSEGGSGLDLVDGVTGASAHEGDVAITIGSGDYSFVVDDTLGEVGQVLDGLDAALAVVAGLRSDGELNSTQADRLTSVIGAGRDAALDALDDVRGNDRTGAATALTAVVTALDQLDDEIAGLDAGTAAIASVEAASTSARTTTDTTISLFLGISASVLLDASGYVPAQPANVTVLLSNAGEEAVSDVRAEITGLESGWSPVPAGPHELAAAVPAGGTAQGDVALTVPSDAVPGTAEAVAAVAYEFNGVTVHVPTPFEIIVDSPLSVESVTLDPSTVAPGGSAQLTAVVRNDGTQPAAGRLEVEVPDDWRQPLPSGDVLVPAGEEATVSLPVLVPRDTPKLSRDVELTASFVRSGATFDTGTAVLTVELPTDPVDPYDHIDLGDPADESAHGLTASESSSTSTEAGLTRRYAGHLTDFSWFEFDMTVDPGEPFVIRAIETYDRDQTKRYKVYVDDEEVALRQHPHTAGAGTETYELVVGAEHATASTVRVKFETQDNHAYYDPSIADVWTLPLEADATAPQVEAALDPATPATGWHLTPAVEVSLDALDNRDDDVAIEYRLGDDAFAGYSGPFEVSGDGVHDLAYRATDAAGNARDGAVKIRIDTVAPETVATPADGFTGTEATTAGVVSLTATDETSGVDVTHYRVDDGEWGTGDSLELTEVGEYRIEFYSTDVAGNSEEVGSLEVTVVAAEEPTEDPTTEEPTEEPTTDEPTEEPTTDDPTDEPTTDEPTEEPTADEPTDEPTPDDGATDEPTGEPTTDEPTAQPTDDATQGPTAGAGPTSLPTGETGPPASGDDLPQTGAGASAAGAGALTLLLGGLLTLLAARRRSVTTAR